MPRPTKVDLEAARGRGVADVAGPGMRLLVVGINPGLWTAAVGAHFARPGNRFYPALAKAGIVDRVIDASQGMRANDEQHLVERGVGITNLVRSATARAAELTATEIRDGVVALQQKVVGWRPRVVAVLGLTAYRTAFAERGAAAGRQPRNLEGAELWALPNPSGLNAHETVDSLAAAYREAAVAAGIVP